jgi:transcription initiation factor TFIID subunit TAF12
LKQQAFESRNKEDFDQNTEALIKALQIIASDKRLKATISELSRVSGIHRNTIRNRRWPSERLEAIKEQRKLEELRIKLKKEKRQDPVSVLAEKLEKSRLEVVYWFNQRNELEQTARALEVRSGNLEKNRDFYLKQSEAGQLEIKKLKLEIEKLKEVISVLESER